MSQNVSFAGKEISQNATQLQTNISDVSILNTLEWHCAHTASYDAVRNEGI